MGAVLSMLKGKTDVLCVIGNFLGLEHWLVAERIQTAIFIMESIEWEDHDEQGISHQLRR